MSAVSWNRSGNAWTDLQTFKRSCAPFLGSCLEYCNRCELCAFCQTSIYLLSVFQCSHAFDSFLGDPSARHPCRASWTNDLQTVYSVLKLSKCTPALQLVSRRPCTLLNKCIICIETQCEHLWQLKLANEISWRERAFCLDWRCSLQGAIWHSTNGIPLL